MIQQHASVVDRENGYVYLQVDSRNNGCSSCSLASGCSTSIVARLFGRRKNYVRVNDHLGLAVGESVVIGLQESVLIKTAFRAYMLPLILMVLAAGLASSNGFTQGVVIAASLAGLVAGTAANSLTDTSTDSDGSPIVLLRRTGTASEVKLTEIQRSM